jgi:hypothetical protein
VSTDTVRIDAPKSRPRTSRITSGNAWRFTAIVWVVHFLLTQIPASLAYRYGSIRTVREHPPQSGTWIEDWGPNSGAWGLTLPGLDGLAGFLVEPFRHWDGTWYVTVANEGYNTTHSANAAFWPLYPWLMNLGSRLTGWEPEVIGYLISNVAFFFAIYYLHRIVTLDFSDTVARRTVWALALFPTAFFFTAIYTESLFFLFAVAALYYARQREWLLAGIIGLLAALTRSAGVMLLAPFGILFLQQYGWNPRRWFPTAFAAALPALGPIIFSWHLTTKELNFLHWKDIQWQWNRFSTDPVSTFNCTLNGCNVEVRRLNGNTDPEYVYPIDWGWIGELFNNLNWTFITSSEFRFRFGESHVLELVVTIIAIGLVLIGLRKLPLYYTAFIVPPLIVPLLTPSSVNPLMSMPRFVLPLFPLFVVVALLVQNRRLGWTLSVISSFLLIILTMQFALWYWVS